MNQNYFNIFVKGKKSGEEKPHLFVGSFQKKFKNFIFIPYTLFRTQPIIEDDDLFNRFPKEFEMMEDHCETVSIPGNFTHLAVSDACINEAMKHKDKPFYGVQFHPEVSGNIGYLLFDNFTRICLKLANEEVN